MKIYKPGHRGRLAIVIAPGVEFPTSEFLDERNKPKNIEVNFVLGQADVSEEIGRYMLDKGLASRSPIIV